MTRTCSKCEDSSAPENAKFCVSCGYPLRQPCPYHDEICQNDEWVPLTILNRPSWRCPHCRGFYRFCSSCYRLYALSQEECETNPERCSHPSLREPFAPWSEAGVDAGHSHGIEIPMVWDGANRQFPPLRTMGQVYGLTYRYGLLCFVAGTALYTLPSHSRRKVTMEHERPNRIDLTEQPLTGEGAANDPHALIMEHGSAYVLTATQAIRVDLWHEQTRALRGRFRKQVCTPTRWIGFGEDDTGKLFACECPAYGDFAVSRRGLLQSSPAQSGRFNLANLTDIVADGETIYLAFRDAICLLQEGILQIYWESGGDNIDSLSVHNSQLLALCRKPQSARIVRLSQGQEAGLPLPFASSEPSSHFVIIDKFVYLFDVGAHQILRYALDQNPPHSQVKGFQAGAEVSWVAGAWHSGRQWLLYALESNGFVQFQVLPVYPEFGADYKVGARLRNDRRLNAVIADGQFVVAATSEDDKSVRLYRLTQDLGEEGVA